MCQQDRQRTSSTISPNYLDFVVKPRTKHKQDRTVARAYEAGVLQLQLQRSLLGRGALLQIEMVTGKRKCRNNIYLPIN